MCALQFKLVSGESSVHAVQSKLLAGKRVMCALQFKLVSGKAWCMLYNPNCLQGKASCVLYNPVKLGSCTISLPDVVRLACYTTEPASGMFRFGQNYIYPIFIRCMYNTVLRFVIVRINKYLLRPLAIIQAGNIKVFRTSQDLKFPAGTTLSSAMDPHRFQGQPSSSWSSCTLRSGRGSALGASEADIALSKLAST